MVAFAGVHLSVSHQRFPPPVAIGKAGRADRHAAFALGCGPVERPLTSCQTFSRKAYQGQ
jgi:hypothetical protein